MSRGGEGVGARWGGWCAMTCPLLPEGGDGAGQGSATASDGGPSRSSLPIEINSRQEQCQAGRTRLGRRGSLTSKGQRGNLSSRPRRAQSW